MERDQPPELALPAPESKQTHRRILIGLLAGAILGLVSNAASKEPAINRVVTWVLAYVTEPVGLLFLRLLLMIVVPLVVASLVLGISRIGDIRKLGRIGLRCFLYCMVISAISVAIGLLLANVIRPGKRIDAATAAQLQQRYSNEASRRVQEAKQTGAKDSPVMDVVKTFVPSNPIAAMAADPPNMLQLLLFTLLFGVALNL